MEENNPSVEYSCLRSLNAGKNQKYEVICGERGKKLKYEFKENVEKL